MDELMQQAVMVGTATMAAVTAVVLAVAKNGKDATNGHYSQRACDERHRNLIDTDLRLAKQLEHLEQRLDGEIKNIWNYLRTRNDT